MCRPETSRARPGTHGSPGAVTTPTPFSIRRGPPMDSTRLPGDQVLTDAIAREAPWAADRCRALGAVVGDAKAQELAHLANENIPELKTYDRYGNRLDWVEFHPAWHILMSLAWQHEVPNLPWRTAERQPHYARAVLSYLWNQLEQGTGCPTGQTYAAIQEFQTEPALNIWADKACGDIYEFSRSEVADKPSVVIGYAMTEKQGGSDLRGIQTTATFSHSEAYHGGTAQWYELTGHKWFCSVPQSDAFFTLAKVEGEVTCFLLPRTLPDGSFNRFFIQRLKDKCGNRSNASSEVEYSGTMAIRVGEVGKGIRQIISQSHLTRLDFAVGSAGLMRQALTLAINHTWTRQGFNDLLAKKPMMANVLADMSVEVESATLLALRAAKATDHIDDSGHERALARVVTPLAKYFNCSRAPALVNEALQCHGGNGFILENAISRLFRESPLNSVWDGTANMMCMDVRRSFTKVDGCRDAFITEVNRVKGMDSRFDALLKTLPELIDEMIDNEFMTRPACDAMARAMQGADLLAHSTSDVISAFLDTRLGGLAGGWGSMFGTMSHAVDKAQADRLVERANITVKAPENPQLTERPYLFIGMGQ